MKWSQNIDKKRDYCAVIAKYRQPCVIATRAAKTTHFPVHNADIVSKCVETEANAIENW